MRNPWLALVVVALTLGFSLWAYPRLPAEVPSHWNLRGQVDDYAPKLLVALLIPAMLLVMRGLFEILPRIDPKRANYPKFIDAYWRIANGSVLVLGALHVTVLGIGLGWDLNVNRAPMIGLGILLLLIGNYLSRIQPNWFIGIRTPWTLSSETVWRKTHRTGSWLFVALGVATVVASLFLRAPTIAVVGPAIALVALVLLVQSYVLWRREQQT
ncbi:MAG: SdpI family protein [Gemmatimonadetes bacterium]|nr:SdpI family protein [Gemmatimonadota bacterium]